MEDKFFKISHLKGQQLTDKDVAEALNRYFRLDHFEVEEITDIENPIYNLPKIKGANADGTNLKGKRGIV